MLVNLKATFLNRQQRMSEEAPQSLPAVLSDPDSPPPPPDGKKKVIHAQRPNNFYWSLKVCPDSKETCD